MFAGRLRTVDLDELLTRLARRIAEARVAANQTQEGLAADLGVSPRYVQRIESGRENLSVATLFRLAQVLSVEVGDFFTPPGKNKPARVTRKSPRPSTSKRKAEPKVSRRRR